MSLTPHIEPGSPDFPGDPAPQPPFSFRDSLRSSVLWSVGLAELSAASLGVSIAHRFTDVKNIDFFIKIMARWIPFSVGIQIVSRGVEAHDRGRPCVYVANHVNIFDMFALYGTIPQYTRALEHIDHFSWPIIGPFLSAAGQIPVDPANPRQAARSLRQAARILEEGHALTVLPEGSRTLDGTVGPFLPGAFRLATRARVPVVPIAIRGGRRVSRRGDWRMRPGRQEVIFGAPLPTENLRLADADELASTSRQIIIDLLHGRREPGA